jgi:hypothetical protein
MVAAGRGRQAAQAESRARKPWVERGGCKLGAVPIRRHCRHVDDVPGRRATSGRERRGEDGGSWWREGEWAGYRLRQGEVGEGEQGAKREQDRARGVMGRRERRFFV